MTYRCRFSTAQIAELQDECSGKNLNLTMRYCKIKNARQGKYCKQLIQARK
jgi:hypothetical protein